MELLEVLKVLAVLAGVLFALLAVLKVFTIYCRWKLKKIEAEMERVEPGSVARMKASIAFKNLADALRKEADEA